MIHFNAQDAQDIAKVLRLQREDTVEKTIVAKATARLLGKPFIAGIVVTAPRQSGKTTELLRYAEETYPGGKFAVICLNKYVLNSICHIYRDLRDDPNVSPPLMLLPDNLKLVGNETKPLFCDELNLFTEELQENILGYRRFVAAVTS